jgi:proton-translocating NADH-quinone oxidoreductase chain M
MLYDYSYSWPSTDEEVPNMVLLFQNPLLLLTSILSLGLILSLAIPTNRPTAIRLLTLVTSLIALFVGAVSCLTFDKSDLGFQLLTRLHLVSEYNLSFTLGADGLSMIFLLLTLFIFPILFLSSWSVTKQPKQFLSHLLAMELLLVLTFSTLDLFYFFVLFESLLIPMFILIGVWGARERKIKAAYYFFLYTLFGSLFMLFGIIYLYFITGSTNYFVLLNTTLQAEQQRLIWLCFFLAFAVKMPLFPFHIWLPEAHVEAPTVGSMLLASLLLKLGGYGFLRFSLTFLSEGSAYYAPLVATCSLLGVLYGSLSTIRQIDLKRIIAYSSVAHMNLVMLGLFSYNQQGLEGATYLMVGHGVVSAALFFCVGVLYDRHHSRLLRYYGGLVTVMPLFATAFFAFTLANMSFPGTSNFLGELLIFLGIFVNNSTILLLSTSGIVLAAVYSIWLYNRVIFGTLKTTYIAEFTDLTRREAVILLSLLIPMVVLGLSANFVLDFVRVALKGITLTPDIASDMLSTYTQFPCPWEQSTPARTNAFRRRNMSNLADLPL